MAQLAKFGAFPLVSSKACKLLRAVLQHSAPLPCLSGCNGWAFGALSLDGERPRDSLELPLRHGLRPRARNRAVWAERRSDRSRTPFCPQGDIMVFSRRSWPGGMKPHGLLRSLSPPYRYANCCPVTVRVVLARSSCRQRWETPKRPFGHPFIYAHLHFLPFCVCAALDHTGAR